MSSHPSSNDCDPEDRSTSVLNPRKRKRCHSSTDRSSSDEECLNLGSNDAGLVDGTEKKLKPQVVIGVRLPGLIYPSSLYNTYDEQASPKAHAEKDVLENDLVSAVTYNCLNLDVAHMNRPELKRRIVLGSRSKEQNFLQLIWKISAFTVLIRPCKAFEVMGSKKKPWQTS